MTTETLSTITTAVTTPEYTGIWVQFLGALFTLVAGALTFLFKKLVDKIIVKIDATEAEREAFKVVLEGMAVAQDQIVEEAKKASADGKLTKDEVEQAKTVAYEHAVEVAKGPVKDLLITWGRTRVDSIIKQYLSK